MSECPPPQPPWLHGGGEGRGEKRARRSDRNSSAGLRRSWYWHTLPCGRNIARGKLVGATNGTEQAMPRQTTYLRRMYLPTRGEGENTVYNNWCLKTHADLLLTLGGIAYTVMATWLLGTSSNI